MSARRDEFFWLGQINKATAVINTDEGLLDRSLSGIITRGIKQVLADGAKPGARRPTKVITFEPLLIEAAGAEITWLHAGRSSQDMHATYQSAMLRDDMLELARQLNATLRALVELAGEHMDTIVPNYTNGVAAQPNSLGHNLLGHAAGLDRDAQRIREAYQRVDRSAMGTTVLNGSSWPLNRLRMADYLGFGAIVDNAYDAAQISSMDQPVEAGAIVTSLALHAGNFIQDVLIQYAQPRPWMILAEGGDNTYVSSAMPQKRNPGLLNDARREATTAITLATGVALQMHNITPGMGDPKEADVNRAMIDCSISVLGKWKRILGALEINPERALQELDNDWTASQELADLLMRKYRVPFRLGHHVASEIVTFARAHDIRPREFSYADAGRIYARAIEGTSAPEVLPMSEREFRSALDPIAIVANRATTGGPQAIEMTRMLSEAHERLARLDGWIDAKQAHIDASLNRLDQDFDRLAV